MCGSDRLKQTQQSDYYSQQGFMFTLVITLKPGLGWDHVDWAQLVCVRLGNGLEELVRHCG